MKGIRSGKSVCNEIGISRVTLWRWAKYGWLKTVNVAGKTYVTQESLDEFNRRAAAGEFGQEPAGAARAKWVKQHPQGNCER